MSAADDLEYTALVLVDALALGDKAAARKWGISDRTVRRYRVTARTDKTLAALVLEKNAEVSHDLATLRVAFLRDALTALRAKLETGTLYEIAGAVKIVGELHQTATMVDDERCDDPSPDAAEAESGVGRTPSGTDSRPAARH